MNDETRSLISNPNSLESSDECGICKNNKRNIKFMPCGHNKTCFDCYNNAIGDMKTRGCPYCKQQICSIIRLDQDINSINIQNDQEEQSEQQITDIYEKINICNDKSILCCLSIFSIVVIVNIIIYKINSSL